MGICVSSIREYIRTRLYVLAVRTYKVRTAFRVRRLSIHQFVLCTNVHLYFNACVANDSIASLRTSHRGGDRGKLRELLSRPASWPWTHVPKARASKATCFWPTRTPIGIIPDRPHISPPKWATRALVRLVDWIFGIPRVVFIFLVSKTKITIFTWLLYQYGLDFLFQFFWLRVFEALYTSKLEVFLHGLSSNVFIFLIFIFLFFFFFFLSYSKYQLYIAIFN